MEALLVIDVDAYNGWKNEIRHLGREKKRVACEIKSVLSKWRRKNGLIIFVVLTPDEQPKMAQLEDGADPTSEAKGTGCIVCDLEHYHLAAFLGHQHGTEYEPAFIKTDEDALTNSELISFLRSEGVTDTTLVGCLTFDCLLETAKGAAKEGLNVSLLEQCAYMPFADDEARQRWISEVQTVNPKIRVEIRQ